jgi:hypothetical protein
MATARPHAGDDDMPPSQLLLALGFALRCRRRRQRRGLHKLLASLGRPHDCEHDGSICSAIAVGVDTLYLLQTRFGAQPHVLQALEQLQSSQHSGLHRYRDTAHGGRCRCLMERIREVQRTDQKDTDSYTIFIFSAIML